MFIFCCFPVRLCGAGSIKLQANIRSEAFLESDTREMEMLQLSAHIEVITDNTSVQVPRTAKYRRVKHMIFRKYAFKSTNRLHFCTEINTNLPADYLIL
jgi:hypothetical protein